MIDPDALAMLTAEPTGGVVWHASRGAITLRVGVRGQEAHVGQAHLGVNAFEHMIAVAKPLGRLAHELLERRTSFPTEDDDARGSMLVVGGAAGAGVNFNVVPGSAWFSVDRRFNPEEDLDEEVAAPDRHDRRSRRRDRCRCDDRRAATPAVGRAPRRLTLRPSRWRAASRPSREPRRASSCAPVCLETRWYAQLGIPAFAYGAGRLDVSHGPDEFIDEAAMGRCAEVYARFAAELLG